MEDLKLLAAQDGPESSADGKPRVERIERDESIRPGSYWRAIKPVHFEEYIDRRNIIPSASVTRFSFWNNSGRPEQHHDNFHCCS